ncbi:MAG: sugar phosphate isomerase/epimerase [Elusimicrobia bacterium]|nr:sugar phosphate isomerase/epimerase [Candidatus Liberimonas magnetica]
MISISTAYNINKHGSWPGVLSGIKRLGFHDVELNVEVPSSWIQSIESSVKNNEVNISSIHNYCPKLEGLPAGKSIFFAYSLASPDKEERNTAVRLTSETIELAKRLNAKAVVIHAGEVLTQPSGSELFKYAVKFGKNAKLFTKYKESILKERKEKSKYYLDNLKKSINTLIENSKGSKVAFGLETRIYYHEIPVIEEFEILFKEFSGAPLYYWHDTGHAEVNVRLGFVKEHEDYLKAFKDKLLGVHLHDLHGLFDHYAPGSGDFDFKRLLPYLNKNTIKVIEAHSQSTLKQVKDSLNYFKKIGL